MSAPNDVDAEKLLAAINRLDASSRAARKATVSLTDAIQQQTGIAALVHALAEQAKTIDTIQRELFTERDRRRAAEAALNGEQHD